MITSLFIAFAVLTLAAIIGLSAGYLSTRKTFAITAGLLVWLGYVGALSYFGVIGNTTLRPPGPMFLFIPLVVLLAIFVVRTWSVGGERRVLAIPLWIILGAQSFRVVVELFLHQLWLNGLIPKMLTFEGANVDIYVGITAPVIAWAATRGAVGLKLAFLWNILGLFALANVVIRAVLTAPGPLNLIHTEVPNLMIGTFPYTFIAGFFVPLALVLQLAALRAIPGRLKNISQKVSEANRLELSTVPVKP